MINLPFCAMVGQNFSVPEFNNSIQFILRSSDPGGVFLDPPDIEHVN
jgi:hypothetical protein